MLFVVWISEISHELSLYCMEKNEWCHFVVRNDSPALISFIACVSFLSILLLFFSYFFVDFTTCLGT